jgi:cell wall-associated NlpC family hydrolase
MPVLSAVEIYRYARLAGFSPDQAVTMTAIALAESGGNTDAHNPHGENSQGLWQVNAAAHPDLAGQNLYDPLVNARAAFEVSQGGQDVSPWTTTHGVGTARYIAYESEAQMAARAAGDTATGDFAGTPGYGHPLSAGAGGSSGGSMPFGDMSTSSMPAGGGTKLDTFVDDALAQAGDSYVFGANVDLHNPNPTSFDCSSLVEWSAAQVGIDLPRTSYGQYLALQQQGATISVEQALHTRGALLFDFSTPPTPGGGRPSTAHVAISLGDGRTIEAMDTQHGVLTATANTQRFNYAAVVPGLDAADPNAAAGSGTAGAAAPAGPPALDWVQRLMVSDLWKVDSDGDGISDGYEVFVLHTNPLKVDSNGDGISDAVALLRGMDPAAGMPAGMYPESLVPGMDPTTAAGGMADPLGTPPGMDPLHPGGSGLPTTSSAMPPLPGESGWDPTAGQWPADHLPGA